MMMGTSDPKGMVLVGGEWKEQAKSPVKAIRQKCLDCQGGNSAEVDRCESVTCALHPFRYGKNPYHSKASAAQRERSGVME